VNHITIWHDNPPSADLIFQDISSLGHDPDSVNHCACLAALNVGFVSFVQASIRLIGPQASGRRTPAGGIGAGRIQELDGGIARA